MTCPGETKNNGALSPDPGVNGERLGRIEHAIAQEINVGRVRHFDVIVHAVEGERAAHPARCWRRSRRGRAVDADVIEARNVVGHRARRLVEGEPERHPARRRLARSLRWNAVVSRVDCSAAERGQYGAARSDENGGETDEQTKAEQFRGAGMQGRPL